MLHIRPPIKECPCRPCAHKGPTQVTVSARFCGLDWLDTSKDAIVVSRAGSRAPDVASLEFHQRSGVMSVSQSYAARYRLNEGLEYWGRRRILTGTVVRCIACRASQAADDAGEQFAHVDGCGLVSNFAHFPWLELHETLRELAPPR